MSLEVVEADGARTGFRTQPAPCDGFLVERGEASIYLTEDDVKAAVARLSAMRRHAKAERGEPNEAFSKAR